jgi:hypothetical protein
MDYAKLRLSTRKRDIDPLSFKPVAELDRMERITTLG